MKCPYCGENMEYGYIQSARQFFSRRRGTHCFSKHAMKTNRRFPHIIGQDLRARRFAARVVKKLSLIILQTKHPKPKTACMIFSSGAQNNATGNTKTHTREKITCQRIIAKAG